MANKITNRVMTQESRFKGELRRFEIYNNKFIKVNIHNIFGDKVYHLNMDIMEPWPVQHRQFSRRWLLALCYFGLATIIYSAYLVRHPDQHTLIRLLPFIFPFLLMTLASLLMFLYNSPNVLEFRSRYGGCVVVSLLKNNPSAEEFKHFSDEFKTRVLAASQAITFDKQQMLEIEMKELLRLNESGVVLDSEYEKAVARIRQVDFHSLANSALTGHGQA